MKNIVPRVAAIHDLSGFGRCSLTVVIPVLSTMGVQVCPVPTAVLSTHSGGFKDFMFCDLTDTMDQYISHWNSLTLSFDCIYSGFVGSEQQMDIIEGFFKAFKKTENQRIVVDPVMGDHGKLYSTYTPQMKKKMSMLVKNADIITPNLTEASFLINEPYLEKSIDELEMKRLLTRLSDIGPKIVIITGVVAQDGCYYNIAYDQQEDRYWKVRYDRIPVSYPGTGDIFTSTLIGGLFGGDNLPMAMDRATQFLSFGVRATYGYKTDEREGIMLEKTLGWLNERLTNLSYEEF